MLRLNKNTPPSKATICFIALRERMKSGADRSESIKILEDASRHFAVPIRYVGEDRQTMILDLLDPAWLSRPSLFP